MSVHPYMKEPPRDSERRAVAEHVVLRLQHLTCRVHGGDTDGGHLAEAEEHDETVDCGKRAQRAVRGRADLVKVADERESPRGRRGVAAEIFLGFDEGKNQRI